MASKTTVQVTIAGRTLTLGGYESEEYLNKVASYINHKIEEFSQLDGYAKQSREVKEILLELNIADDYFKAKKQIEVLEEELEAKERDLSDLKHEMVNIQMNKSFTDKGSKEIPRNQNKK